jgi:hypothetical protein
MTERSESTRQSDQQPQAGPDAPAPPTAAGPSNGSGPAPAATPEPPAEKPTVYRSGGAFFGGLIVVVLGLLGIIDLLVEGGTRNLLGVTVVLLVTSLAFAYGIYPAAYTTSGGLRIRNQFRTIVLPWSAVTDLTAKLSFVAHTAQKRYTVWAIPVSLHERRKAERGRMKDLTRADRDARRAVRGTTRLSDIAVPAGRRADPIDRLSYADQALREMGDRREQYAQAVRAAKAANPDGQGPEPAPEVSFAWPVPLAIGISALLVVLAAVL